MTTQAETRRIDWWACRARARRTRNRWAWRGWGLIDWGAVDEWAASNRSPLPHQDP